jgi:copper transport protein
VLLRRALRWEVTLLVLVFGVTAALTAYPPPSALSSGPFSTTRTIGPAQMQLTVDPSRAGRNQIHLYLLNPRDGTQFTRAKEVQLSASLPDKHIGPIAQTARNAGPGHYIVPDATLTIPGNWTLNVTVRISDFDEYGDRISVPVSP